jgi:signal transduction histidine kinase
MLGLPSVPSEPVELPVPPALASAAIPPAPALAAAVPRGRSVQAPVRMLHLEDSEPDHALVLAQLRRSGLPVAVQRVETRADFTLALAERWDVIVSDFHLPGFTGVQALQLLKEHVAQGGRAVPFILVSGQIGEDVAVEAMRNGAADYLLKNNLARLAPAIEHAIEAAEEQRARRAADAELQVSRARLSALAQHLQTSVEAERSAIAREIHDEVGGSLTALKFELDWIRRHAGSEALQARADRALETVSNALQVSQRIMQNLRPAILEQGLVAALQWLCSSFEKRTGVHCGFRTGRELPTLPQGVPLVVYRTAQEALTNISKHAAASRVQVDLSLTEGVLSLEVSDNGRGLSDADLAKARSFGIRGLHERASHVGGWVDLSSSPGGTSLIVSVPLAQPVLDATLNLSPATPEVAVGPASTPLMEAARP